MQLGLFEQMILCRVLMEADYKEVYYAHSNDGCHVFIRISVWSLLIGKRGVSIPKIINRCFDKTGCDEWLMRTSQ